MEERAPTPIFRPSNLGFRTWARDVSVYMSDLPLGAIPKWVKHGTISRILCAIVACTNREDDSATPLNLEMSCLWIY